LPLEAGGVLVGDKVDVDVEAQVVERPNDDEEEHPMIQLRKASARGRSRTEWLDSRHTFSFADYFDPKFVGFGKLRVINDDVVAPSRGFGRHPHRDMEILSYVLAGSLEHGDSMGNGSVIRPGDVQRMSAGTGVVHSEANPSATEPVRFLQIWIEPEQRGLPPSYEQKRFDPESRRGVLRLVASRDGRDGSVTVHQDASVYAALLGPGQRAEAPLASGRRAWVQVARGSVTVNGEALSEGDGAAIEGEERVTVEGNSDSEVIVFDLA
jgi:redox-sensitive bicupin YhaK (pirin superfamily)